MQQEGEVLQSKKERVAEGKEESRIDRRIGGIRDEYEKEKDNRKRIESHALLDPSFEDKVAGVIILPVTIIETRL